MQKKHLFAIISFFAIIGWLEVLQINTGFVYACMILLIFTGINLIYSFCNQDEDGDN
jgi:hypothetical protein